MEKAVKQRIRSLLAEFGSNPTVLAKEYSVNQKTLNNQINSDTQLSASTILLVLNAFSGISAEWLLRGKGEMLNQPSEIVSEDNINTNDMDRTILETLSNLNGQIRDLKAKVNRLERENAELRRKYEPSEERSAM